MLGRSGGAFDNAIGKSSSLLAAVFGRQWDLIEAEQPSVLSLACLADWAERWAESTLSL